MPPTDADLAAKFLELAAPPLGDNAAHDLLATLNETETLGAAAIATLGTSTGSCTAGLRDQEAAWADNA